MGCDKDIQSIMNDLSSFSRKINSKPQKISQPKRGIFNQERLISPLI